jgi:hypothetical protein
MADPNPPVEVTVSDSVSVTETAQTVVSDQQVTIPKETFDSLMQLKQDVQDVKKDFITVFGIFASFVTFLSVEIQVFKTVTNFWLLLGLSAFLLASVLLFAFMILNMAKEKLDWSVLKTPVPVLILLFLIISFFFFFIYAMGEFRAGHLHKFHYENF